jgi:hypothetical protein
MKKNSALLLVDAMINLALSMPLTFCLADLAVLLDVVAGLAFTAAITHIFAYLRWR